MPRRLGQHFLRPGAVRRLVQAIAPARTDVFLEIGPGRGALTLPLLEVGARVVAVEKDPALARRLREEAPAHLEVVEGDALEVDLPALVPPGTRLVGNLPYYVSSPLLRRFLDARRHFRDLHAMLQEEVAERVAAPPGSRDYGILSVHYALWAEVELLLRFPPGAFDPPPKVRSAVLRARFRETPRAEVPDPAAFEALVRHAFARRRRTLENNLRDRYPDLKERLAGVGLAGTRRAETLSVEEFARLSRALPEVPPFPGVSTRT
jgi:16S rRNA (adenine1518-N6/adenine1519-N6)-dimethyltransferase